MSDTEYKLTDAEIEAAITKGVRAGEISWLGYKQDNQGAYTLPELSLQHYQAARAIEAATAAKLNERIAELESSSEPLEGNWIAADDYYRNVKALDVALNGHGGATRPSLIDVLSQVEQEARTSGKPLLPRIAELERELDGVRKDSLRLKKLSDSGAWICSNPSEGYFVDGGEDMNGTIDDLRASIDAIRTGEPKV